MLVVSGVLKEMPITCLIVLINVKPKLTGIKVIGIDERPDEIVLRKVNVNIF